TERLREGDKIAKWLHCQIVTYKHKNKEVSGKFCQLPIAPCQLTFKHFNTTESQLYSSASYSLSSFLIFQMYLLYLTLPYRASFAIKMQEFDR
ncbi:MAG: hypothetical protein V5A59_10120, partial [Bacteroidales bacterium]